MMTSSPEDDDDDVISCDSQVPEGHDRNAMGIIIGPFVRFNIKYNLLSRQE